MKEFIKSSLFSFLFMRFLLSEGLQYSDWWFWILYVLVTGVYVIIFHVDESKSATGL